MLRRRSGIRCLPGNESGPAHDRFVRSTGGPGDGPLPATDRGDCVCAGDESVAMDRAEADYFDAADFDLSGAAGAIRSEAALRDYADGRPGDAAGEGGGPGDCGGAVSRAAAWDSVGREGPAGYGGDSYDVWGGAFSGPDSDAGTRWWCSGCTRRARCWWRS